MRNKARINTKYPYRLYLPDEIARDGFTGDIELLVGGKVIVIVKPETTLSDIEASLNLIISSERLSKSGYDPVGVKACDQD